nr:unnamed protein product [Callosobruchus analis]
MTENDQTEDEQNNDSHEIVNDLQALKPDPPLGDDQIIAAVIETVNKESTNEDLDGEEDEPPTRILHTDAKNAFDIALQYIEQNPTSTPMDIL